MAELNNKINILVSADASQADRVLRQVTPTIGGHGQAAGEQWGRGFHSASSKWVRAIGALLRRFGGEFGAQIAENLHLFERFEKAKIATERIGGAEGGIAGRAVRTAEGAALGQAGGTAAGRIAETAIGAGIGVKAANTGAVPIEEQIENAVQGLIRTGAGTRSGKINRPLFFKVTSLYEKARNELDAVQFERFKETFEKGVENLPPKKFTQQSAELVELEALQSKVLFKHFAKNVTGISALQKLGGTFANVFKSPLGAAGALGAGLGIPILFFTHMAKAREEMQKLAKEAGLTVGVFGKLKEDKEFLEIWKKFGQTGIDAAEKIGEIKDASERNKAAVKEFGDDGINTFHKLIEAAETYKKAQGEVNYTVEALKDTWAITGHAISGFFKTIGEWIGKNLILPITPSGIGEDLAKQLAEGEANLLRLTKMTEEQNKKIAEDQKTQGEINKEIADTLEKHLDIEKALELKRKVANSFTKEMLKDKKTELEYVKLLKEIADDEDKLNKQKQEDMRSRLDLQDKLNDELEKYLDDQLTTQEKLNEKLKEYYSYSQKDLTNLANKIKYLEIINDILKLQKQLQNETPTQTPIGSIAPSNKFGFPLGGKKAIDQSKLTLGQMAGLHPDLKDVFMQLNKLEMAQQNYAPGTQGFDFYKTAIQGVLTKNAERLGATKGQILDPMVKAFIENGMRLPILPVMSK